MDGWIIVPHWDRFQHYKNRNPPWIKLYTELNSSDDWCSLTLAERGLLVGIWLEYARSNGQFSTLDVAKRLDLADHYAHVSKHLKALTNAGFIEVVASKPLAPVLAPEEKIVREEKKLDPTLARESGKPVERPTSPPAEGVEQIVERLIRNGVIHDLVDLNAEIAGYRINGKAADRLRELL